VSWAIGFDSHWERDIGYGVPAFCDHPRCRVEIDRGMAFVCGGEPYGGDHGCGLYFCAKHLSGAPSQCARCRNRKPPFPAKPDHPRWLHHKLTDASWATWRAEHMEMSMFLASASLDHDEQLLVMGLSHANLERLKQGQPIQCSRETHGLAVPAGLKILIFTGESEEAMKQTMAGLIGPTTVVDQLKAH
jgi:hypothetical protein